MLHVAVLRDHFTLISFTSKATATFGGKPVRGSLPNALSGGNTISHFEPAGIWRGRV